MKTPEQWLEIIRARGATTQPAGTLRLVRQIQDDALEYAVGLCIQHAHTGNPQGWTDTVSQECARIINSKRVTAMPNAELSESAREQQKP